jgi:hypothetical protein
MVDKDKPIHEVHRLKAIDHFTMAERAMDTDDGEALYEQAIMNCHFGVEMIMKAAIYKAGGVPPTSGANGHNLLKIASTKVGNRKFLQGKINSNRSMLPMWGKIHSAWDTNKRYSFMDLPELDYEELYEAYRRFYQWIKVTFVE